MKIVIMGAVLILTVVVILVYSKGDRAELKSGEREHALPPIDLASSRELKTATFAMGCFWGVEARFGVIPGVIRTSIGYAGGTTENPTYHAIGDHIETVQVEYDPRVISYEALLELFWEGHVPTTPSWKRQYMSTIFYHDDEQKQLALKSRDREEKMRGEIYTEIMPFTGFYLAEEYHQKYHLRQSGFMSEFEAVYPSFEEFMGSTAAARVNGYVSGYGTLADLQEEIERYGLSSTGEKRLLELVQNRSGTSTCTVGSEKPKEDE